MPAPSERWLALDAFRGLSVAGMVLVNNPGSWSHVYPPLAHAAWHGLTPTDLVFPFFLFTVGVSLTVSFARRLGRGDSRTRLLAHVARRGLVIVLFGLLLSGFPGYDLATMRVPGVLQRIGVVYLIAAAAYLLLSRAGRRWLTAGLLVGYWAAMMLIPVPGAGAGSLTMEHNLAQYVDSLLLAGHMWQPNWDPEGLLSTFPAVATCLLGTFAGDWLRQERPLTDRALGLFVAGGLAAVVGWVWGAWFPVNKSLWTSSYVLLSGGLAMLLLAWLVAVVDWRGWTRWTWPFRVYGGNALLVFLLTGLAGRLLGLARVGEGIGAMTLKAWIYDHGFASWAGPLNGSLAFALAFVLCWLAPMALLHRKGIFLKV
jgi:predicted acyltransferase